MKLFRFFKNFTQKPSTLVGLTLDQISLKLVELGKLNDHFFVHACTETALPSAHFSFDHPEFSDFLKKSIQASHITTNQVSLALPDTSVLFKSIELDKNLNEAEITIQVQECAKQYFNYPLSELAIDFEVLNQSNKHSDLREVRWVAARRVEVETQVNALSTAGLTVVAMEIDSLSLKRAAQFYVRSRHPGVKIFAAVQVYSSYILMIIISQDVTIYTILENYTDESYLAISHSLQQFLNNSVDSQPSLVLFSGYAVENLLARVKDQFNIKTDLLDILSLLKFSSPYIKPYEFSINAGLAMWRTV